MGEKCNVKRTGCLPKCSQITDPMLQCEIDYPLPLSEDFLNVQQEIEMELELEREYIY